jgi:hypothetical protein
MKWSELMMMIQGLSMKNIVQRKRFDQSPGKNKMKRKARIGTLFSN